VDSFAVQNAYEATLNEPWTKVTGLVNIGSDVTNINIVHNNIPLFTRDLSVGSNKFIEELQRELGVSFEEADAMVSGHGDLENDEKLRGIIADACEELSLGIDRSISFLKTAGDAEHIDEVVLSGGGARIPWLREILTDKHEIEFKINDSLSAFEQEEDLAGGDELEKVAPLLTVSLGLALRREGN
jgi:type IV pilus assembly protein PilM